MANSRKLALITGANTGIGKKVVEQLYRKNTHDIVLACRNVTMGDEVIRSLQNSNKSSTSPVTTPTLTTMELDLSSFASIRQFANAFRSRYAQLDLCIANAGVGGNFIQKEPLFTKDQNLELTVGTNHFGHFYLIGELLPLLKPTKGTIVIVASRMHLQGKLDRTNLQLLNPGTYNGSQAYSNSKLFNVLFALELHKRYYASHGIRCNSVHPGFIPNSDFLRNQLSIAQVFLKYIIYPIGRIFGFTSSVTEGAQAELQAADSPESGCYFHQLSGPQRPSSIALSEDNQKWLWEESERITGFVYPKL